jgi:predicted nucleic acid-binding protein
VIAYFDTSAVVPLLVDEPGSVRAESLWATAERVVSARLVYPEARAALAHAARLGRLTATQLRAAVGELDARMTQLDIVEIDESLAKEAGALAEARRLRGYDAVHLAAAVRVRDEDLVVVAGDEALLEAATAEGLATATVF